MADASGFPLLQMDLNDETSIAKVIEDIKQREGRLDVVVNNAGSAQEVEAEATEG